MAAVSPVLLELLRCPESGKRLTLAPPEIVAALEARRVSGMLQLSATQSQLDLSEPIEAALLREDGRVCYPIQHGIALLLPGHALDC